MRQERAASWTQSLQQWCRTVPGVCPLPRLAYSLSPCRRQGMTRSQPAAEKWWNAQVDLKMGLMLRFKKKNRDSRRSWSLEQPCVQQNTGAGEDTDTPVDKTERRQWGQKSERMLKQSALLRPHQHVLRYVERHGFFSALLILAKVLLVDFKYTEGAQPLTFVPAHKHNIHEIC